MLVQLVCHNRKSGGTGIMNKDTHYAYRNEIWPKSMDLSSNAKKESSEVQFFLQET